jgi:fructose-bisphosphate aldolase class II
MTVANLKDVLQPAMRNGQAIAGLVVLGWEDACAYVEAADETGIPVILQAGPGCRKYTPVPVLGKMFRHLAEQARVPVVCHIDHAYTIEECIEGIDSGFTSVMIDGSRFSIDENIALTASVVARAQPAGISVEGEVGVVGYAAGDASAFTSPSEAQRFDKESGADALAISIGNIHLNTEKSSSIDFETLHSIEAVTRLPLVLHGSSGIPVVVRQKLARESRITKFNIGTELRMAFGVALRKSLAAHPKSFDRIELLKETIPAIRKEVIAVIQSLWMGDQL